jgi:hypothetical protein
MSAPASATGDRAVEPSLAIPFAAIDLAMPPAVLDHTIPATAGTSR